MRSLRGLLLASAVLFSAACNSAITADHPGSPAPPDAGSPPPPACDAACQASTWSLDLGGAGQSNVLAIGSDAAGDVVLEVAIGGAANTLGVPPNASLETLLVKLDGEGHVLWTKSLSAAAEGGAPLLAVRPSGNIVLAGSIAGGVTLDFGGGPLTAATAPATTTFFVAELDPAGHQLWSQSIDAKTGTMTDNQFAAPGILKLDPAGNVFVAGTFVGPLDLGDGQLGFADQWYTSDVFLLALDAAGHRRWSRRVGTAKVDPTGSTGTEPGDIAFTADGDLLFALTMYGAADFGGQTLQSAGWSDIVLAKMTTTDGSLLSAVRWGGPDYDDPLAMVTAADGTIFLSGSATDTFDLGGVTLTLPPGQGGPFVAALDPGGNVRWAVPGPELSSGAAWVAGADPQNDAVVAFLDPSQPQFTMRRVDGATGATLHERIVALQDPSDLEVSLQVNARGVDPTGHALLGGAFRGIVDFGEGPLTNTDLSGTLGTSAFVVKTIP